METLANVFIFITASLHFSFCYLEMFLWTRPEGLTVFRMSLEKAESSSQLAANQGVYNALLGLGLLSTYFLDPASAFVLRCYILLYIIVVGTYGWYSLKNMRIFLIQALPAILALVALTY